MVRYDGWMYVPLCAALVFWRRRSAGSAALFLVLAGKLSVTASTPRQQTIARLGAGEIVGEMSYVDSRPASATVTATEQTQVLRVAREVVTAKLATDVGFSARFYRALAVFLAHRLRNTVAKLGYGDAPSLRPDEEAADELDPDLLDNLSLGAARFDWLLNKLKG